MRLFMHFIFTVEKMLLLLILTFPKPKHWTVSDMDNFAVIFLLKGTSTEPLNTNTSTQLLIVTATSEIWQMQGWYVHDSRSEKVQEWWHALESLGGNGSDAPSLSGQLRLRQTPHDRHAVLNETHHLNHYKEKTPINKPNLPIKPCVSDHAPTWLQYGRRYAYLVYVLNCLIVMLCSYYVSTKK